MWCSRSAAQTTQWPTNTGLLRSAKSLLDSAYYHLYAHRQLTYMKSLLDAPESLGQVEEVRQIFKENCDSTNLRKALSRAAEALREDCRQGLKYLQKIGLHRSAPLTTTSIFEGGMRSLCHCFPYLVSDFSISRALANTSRQGFFCVGIFERGALPSRRQIHRQLLT